jgi:hypothetical protein
MSFQSLTVIQTSHEGSEKCLKKAPFDPILSQLNIIYASRLILVRKSTILLRLPTGPATNNAILYSACRVKN